MIIQVFETCSDDCDCNDYEEDETFRVGREAISASYAILDDQDPDDNERRGDLSKWVVYVFRNNSFMALVDGRWIGREEEADNF